MRPIDRGNAPMAFTNYEDAKPYLTNRLGTYCSFCERRIPTNLAVEHILPKDPALGFAHLRNEWTNFLLGCVNCNSSKGTTVIDFATHLLPDRDNTFPYFQYSDTGEVEAIGHDPAIRQMAQNTLDLVGLNTEDAVADDDTILFSALKRSSQRFEAWKIAKKIRTAFDNNQTTAEVISLLAAAYGFFSIWMKAFEGIPEVRLALINVFAHTSTNCFDGNGNSVTPRPANVQLQNSGKA